MTDGALSNVGLKLWNVVDPKPRTFSNQHHTSEERRDKRRQRYLHCYTDTFSKEKKFGYIVHMLKIPLKTIFTFVSEAKTKS